MGAFWSKAENHSSPRKNCKIHPEVAMIDPRSPTIDINRTPIQSQSMKTSLSPVTKHLDLSNPTSPPKNTAANIFKQKMLRMESFDPRSPTVAIDRTPIVFIDENEDYEADETADLSAECSYLSDVKVLSQEITESLQEINIEEVTPVIEVFDKNPLLKLINNDKSDPRSPTVGIERTPIVLQEEPVVQEKEETVEPEVKQEEIIRALPAINKFVFEDDASIKFSTPKKGGLLLSNGESQRTPLSCLANKAKDRVKTNKAFREHTFNNSGKGLLPKVFVDDQENEKTPVLTSDINRKLPNSAALLLSTKSRIPVMRVTK